LTAGIAAGLATVLGPTASRAKPPHPWSPDYFTNVELTTHDGRRVRFYEDLIRGKTVIIDFIYTACGDVCPGMTQNLAGLQDLLGDRLGRDVFIYSLTLDPEHDTPEALKAYAENFEARPGWLFLTGAAGDIDLLRRRVGYTDFDAAVDTDLTQHMSLLRIGNEPHRRWIMSPGLIPPDAILANLMRVDPGEPHA
jgi:protein SCO1/2